MFVRVCVCKCVIIYEDNNFSWLPPNCVQSICAALTTTTTTTSTMTITTNDGEDQFKYIHILNLMRTHKTTRTELRTRENNNTLTQLPPVFQVFFSSSSFLFSSFFLLFLMFKYFMCLCIIVVVCLWQKILFRC